MKIAYPNLLSPYKIGDTIIRNRMISGPSMAHFMQGPEQYPAQTMIELFAERAKNGAGIVTVGCALPKVRHAETAHAAYFDLTDIKNQNYFCHLTEIIRFHGAKASFMLEPPDFQGFDCSTGFTAMRPKGAGFDPTTGVEMTHEMIEQVIQEYVDKAKYAKICGFDMISLHSSYRFFIISRFLSPLTNTRTDEYGGSRENRVRLLKEICTRIKAECGKDFLIEVTISAMEPEGGIVPEDLIEWCRMLEGLVDIMQIRAGEIDPNHPTGYCKEVTPFLKYAAQVKASNPPMAIACVAGFQDLNICEKAIAEGKIDFVVAARAWISNPDWGIKAYEGRNEDIVPCIRCNKCHIASRGCTFNSVCSVNPTWGSIAARLPKAVTPPDRVRKIAVVGGGIAGIEAAVIAAKRGHEVDLYEKTGVLGGQLIHADHATFKWPLRKFKNFKVQEVQKSSVNIHMNTEVTPEMLQDKDYDHVIVAIGPEPVIPGIEGLEETGYYIAADVFMHDLEKELGKEVVVIGGGDIGTETGLYLEENGHHVFVIEMQAALCIDATPVHYRAMVEDYWNEREHFRYALNARCSRISPEGVTYIDAEGKEQFVKADSIVLAAGMKPRAADAVQFYGIGTYTSVIGDCAKPGSVQKSMRGGYEAGIRL